MSELNRRASDTLIIEMHRDLGILCKQMEQVVGNGQPGILDEHSSRIDVLETTANTVKGWVKGVVWLSGGLMTILGLWLAFHGK